MKKNFLIPSLIIASSLFITDAAFAGGLCVNQSSGAINTRSKCKRGEYRLDARAITSLAGTAQGPKGDKGDPGTAGLLVNLSDEASSVAGKSKLVKQVSCPEGHAVIGSACLGGVAAINSGAFSEIFGQIDSTGNVVQCTWNNTSSATVTDRFFAKALCAPF